MSVRKEYLGAIYKALSDHPSWRFGQTVFNVAHQMFPDIANKYRGTESDPFYLNDRAEAFIETVIQEAEGKCSH